MTVSRVVADDLTRVWPTLSPQIKRGLRKGGGDTITEQYLFTGVAHGEIDLWVVHEGKEVLAGVFLRVDQRERGKALVVLMAAAGTGVGFGDYAEDIVPRLREYGQMIGAYTVESYTRPGVTRILKRLGCKPKAHVMELYDERRRT